MKPIQILALFTFLFFSSLFSSAQTYFFDNYSVKDGLAQSKVYNIIQDSQGYIWLGTESGVTRFDGASFQNFTNIDGIADNGVRVIFEDNQNNLWFGHKGGGISRYYNQHFEKVIPDTFDISGDITSITLDKDSTLWIGTHSSGAIRIKNPKAGLKKLEFEQFKGAQKLSDRVFGIVPVSNQQLLFIIDGGLKTYLPEKNSFDFLRMKDLPLYFQITCLLEDSKKNLWFGTYNGGLYKHHPNGEFSFYDVKKGLADNWVSTLYEDTKGNIWVGTWGGGITKFSGEKSKIYNNKNGLSDQKIWSIIEDREGNILIGTNEHGFYIYKGERFVSYSEEDGMINQQVWAITQDDKGRYWYGTNQGITVFDSTLNTKKSVTHFTQENRELVSNQIRYLKKDNNGDIWIGTGTGGVQQFLIEKNKFDYNLLINRYFPRNNFLVTAMEIDKSNNLWVGTTDGLIYYEIDNHKVARLTQINGLTGNEISCLYCDSRNIVWVGARGKGITTIDDTTFAAINFESNITPTSICEDKQGNYWIGTESQGVLVSDGQKIIDSYKSNQGILADYITTVLSDDKNNIYLGTNRGLNKYVPEENKFFTYTEKSGFVGIEVKNSAAFIDNKGNIWFGTVKGAIKYNPKLDSVNTLEPLIHIKQFRVNLEERAMADNLKLNYQEKSIRFDYAAICLSNPEQVRYQVMLEGLDSEWLPPTRQTYMNYPSLPPGKYTFKVKAKNNSGIWNQQPASYTFTINPPFWQTWWFISICVVLIIISIFIYIKMRERQLIREKKILEEKVAERTAEVVQKNDELAAKNKDITDSIRYAKRIQEAILPDNEYISNGVSDYFILFKPRDIVSGDFYWLTYVGNKTIVAAVDCTGHGVPGAFMSMLGVAFLNEIVNKRKVIKASEILEELREHVISSLKQTGREGEAQDGMDMALVIIDREIMKMQYAGAYNPLYIIRNSDKTEPEIINRRLDGSGKNLYQIRADRMPIGYQISKRKDFTNHEISIYQNDSFYMFSDGYIDQFGGNNGSKFLSKNFKKLLLQIQDSPMKTQKQILDQRLIQWQGDHEQVDDILVIGIKI